MTQMLHHLGDLNEELHHQDSELVRLRKVISKHHKVIRNHADALISHKNYLEQQVEPQMRESSQQLRALWGKTS